MIISPKRCLHAAAFLMLFSAGAADGSLMVDDALKDFVPISRKTEVPAAGKTGAQCLPRGWTIDFKTLSAGCGFSCDENGFRIDSPNGRLKVYAPARRVLNDRWTVEIRLSLLSADTVVETGIYDAGLVRHGTDMFGKFSGTAGPIDGKFGISCLDGYDICAPVITVKGHAVIHRLRIRRESVPGCSVVEGTVKVRSRLPAPEQTDYPDCCYTAHFIGSAVKNGKTLPRETALTIPGFKNKKTLLADGIRDGDKIECVLLPFSALPDDRQSIQQADDLQLFSLESYYALSLRKIPAFSEDPYNPGSGTFFMDDSGDYVSIFRRGVNPPVGRKQAEDQAARISRDLAEARTLLAGWDARKKREIAKKFKAAWDKEKAKDADGRNRNAVNNGIYVWRKMGKAYFQLHQYFYDLFPDKKIDPANIEALVNLKQALAANGVQLVISLIPDRNQISARVMNPEFRDVPDSQSLDGCMQLLENGIEAVSPWRQLIDDFDGEEFCFSLYADPHPSTLAQKTAAKLLARRLARYGLKKELAAKDFAFSRSPANHFAVRALWPENCDIGEHKAGSPVMVKQPLFRGKPLAPDRGSGILIVGDSFSETPYIKANAIAAWLAFFTGCNVDFHQFSGNGPETVFIRQLLHDPVKFLKNKKVLILHTGMHALYGYKWVDIKQTDAALEALSRSRHVAAFSPARAPGDLGTVEPKVLERRKKLPSGTDYVIGDGPVRIAEIGIDKARAGKKLLCVIPAALFKGDVTLTVNGVEKKLVAGFLYGPVGYHNLTILLPEGGEKITIDARGSKNAYFVVNDIEIRELKP